MPPLRKVDVSDQDGDTALMIAARANQLRAVQLLLTRRASVAVKNELGSTALHAAAKGGHAEVVRLFLGKCSVDARDNAGHTPLHDSVWNGHTAVAELLLAAGASTQITQPSTGKVALLPHQVYPTRSLPH